METSKETGQDTEDAVSLLLNMRSKSSNLLLNRHELNRTQEPVPWRVRRVLSSERCSEHRVK